MKKLLFFPLFILCLSLVGGCRAEPATTYNDDGSDNLTTTTQQSDEEQALPDKLYFKGLVEFPYSDIPYESTDKDFIAAVWALIDPALWEALPADFVPQHMTSVQIEVEGDKEGLYVITSEDTACYLSPEYRNDPADRFGYSYDVASAAYSKLPAGTFDAVSNLLAQVIEADPLAEITDLQAYFSQLLDSPGTLIGLGEQEIYVKDIDPDVYEQFRNELLGLLTEDNLQPLDTVPDGENHGNLLHLRNIHSQYGLWEEVDIYTDPPYAYITKRNSHYWYAVTPDLQEALAGLGKKYF